MLEAMPIVPFHHLPDDARLWVFAASDPLTGDRADALLAAVDDFLAQWQAHGQPLTVARDWRDDRFLAVAVDQRAEGASGCSIDGLYRHLQRLEQELGTALVRGGRVFWRDGATIRVGDRAAFRAAAPSADAVVYDTTLTDAGAWRSRFAVPAPESWAAR
jgi:hypothetical protein